MHWYEFRISDYVTSTQHLDDMEDLAYRRMLDLYYREEGPLPADVKQIARLIRMRSHTESIENVLQEFFVLDADGFRNISADKQLEKIYKKSAAARKSAEARWQKKKEKECLDNANASKKDANALETQTESKPDELRQDSECNAKAMLPNNLTTQQPKYKKNMSPKGDSDVVEIFAYWRKTMDKNNSTSLSAKERKSHSCTAQRWLHGRRDQTSCSELLKNASQYGREPERHEVQRH